MCIHRSSVGHARYMYPFLILALLIFLAPVSSFCEQLNGGYSMQYATSALTIPFRAQQYVVHTRGSSVSTDAGTWTNATGAFSFSYGYKTNLELELTAILYQDLNLAAEYTTEEPGPEDERQATNIPDNLYFRWKYGNMRLTSGLPLFFGVQGTAHMRLSKGTITNVWLEPYYGDKMSTQINLLFSYISNPLYPDDGFQAHYNVGYINLNDAATFSKSTDALKVYFGLYYPFSPRFAGMLETQGTYFFGYPEFAEDIFSMEEYGYITPSIRYRFSNIVSYVGGVDILFYEGEENTSPLLQPEGFPNYPGWRISSKLVFTPIMGGIEGPGYTTGAYMPGAMPMAQPSAVGGAYGAANRAALYDWGGSVKDDVQYIEVELDKIREDRRKAEEKLQKIKKKLKSGNK